MGKDKNATSTVAKTFVYVEQPRSGEASPTVTMCQMQDGAFVAVKPSDNGNIFFAGISQGSSVISRMVGADYAEMVELLTRAVNNRTRQRNFFRLQNNLLEGIISEDDFYKEIEEKEDEYVVEEKESPSPERLCHAMILSQGIKDVQNSEDLSTLFSFSSEVTDLELKKIESDGSLQQFR
jgi:hypothetical protein